jgi:hypothetical protein
MDVMALPLVIVIGALLFAVLCFQVGRLERRIEQLEDQ